MYMYTELDNILEVEKCNLLLGNHFYNIYERATLLVVTSRASHIVQRDANPVRL
jgi:hypothetical protein